MEENRSSGDHSLRIVSASQNGCSRQMAHIGMLTEKAPATRQKPPPPPVIAVRLKKTTAEVIRSSQAAQGGGRRGAITCISMASIKNAVETLANADPELNSMLVCTYPETYPDDGRIVKCHHKRMLQALQRKFGDFSYFTAIEYQSRGAPHFHVGLSLDLNELGEVVKLVRNKGGRRKPAFETVKSVQDWAFKTWIGIISEPDPIHNGEILPWYGLDGDDDANMRSAYNYFNAGFSWEVMRDTDGAKKYFVKELTGLKGYQKQIPDNFQHPGRHFLYSDDMRFNPDDALEFIVSDAELRVLLKNSGWEYLPDPGKPLFKRLWNAAGLLAAELINAGMAPIEGGIEALRKYWDVRMFTFADKASEMWREMAWDADTRHILNARANWERIKRKLSYEAYWGDLLASSGA